MQAVPRDAFEDGVERGDFEIDQIDGDLHLIARGEWEADGFYGGQSAGRFTDFASDGAGDGEIVSAQIDIPCHEKFAGPDYGNSGGGMRAVPSKAADVGRQGCVGQLADVFEAEALGAQGGGFVEIYGDAEFVPDAAAGLMRESGAVIESEPADGNEGDDVGCAEARVNAGVAREVDEFGCGANGREGCRADGLGRAREGHDRAVVVGVRSDVEELDAGGGGDGASDARDDDGIAAFGEIRHAFDNQV